MNDLTIKILKENNINYTVENNRIIIIGGLYLDRLTSVDKDFLKDCTINGYLSLNALTSVDKDILRSNVKWLEVGYNELKGYCYFDGILSKVIRVSVKGDYTIYESSFEFIIQKGEYTSHGKTVKKGILDLEFKIVSDRLKQEPISVETIFTVKYYRILTGACDNGCRKWLQDNSLGFKIIDGETVENEPMSAKELKVLLDKTKPFGYEKFNSLLMF